MDDLTAFQRDLLYMIAGIDRPYGLKVKRDLEEYYTDEINHSRLYQNMDRLVEEGLLEKGSIDDRTNLYRLTSEGRDALVDRREWEREHLRGETLSH